MYMILTDGGLVVCLCVVGSMTYGDIEWRE